jgi:nucleotide-binding universal stress UspA family protein
MGSSAQDDEAAMHRYHVGQLRQWARGLDRAATASCPFHVLQSDDVAGALLAYAQANHVSLIVMGAATHGLALKRWIPTVPARVAAEAPCSVLLVKDAPPFALLSQASA